MSTWSGSVELALNTRTTLIEEEEDDAVESANKGRDWR